MKQVVRLENWALLESQTQTPGVLMGIVFGHSRIADGTAIVTSVICGIGNEGAETRNTRYILGKPARSSCCYKSPGDSFVQGDEMESHLAGELLIASAESVDKAASVANAVGAASLAALVCPCMS